jgi:hypothetical protein
MIDRIGRAIAAADTDNGDFGADTARYRRMASAVLKPLTRPAPARRLFRVRQAPAARRQADAGAAIAAAAR